MYLIAALLLFLVPLQAQDASSELISSEIDFSLSFYQSMKATEGNIVFSPYSVFTGFSMLSIGAKGETAKEISSTLKLKLKPKELAKASARLSSQLKNGKSYELQLANGLWIENDVFLLSDFRRSLEDDFQAAVQTLNFRQAEEATKTINDWVSKSTKETIPSLLTANDIDPETKAVLTSAIYFKGLWARPFNPTHTKKASFHPQKNLSVSVQMMEQTAQFPYLEDEMMQVLALPIAGKTGAGGQLACLLMLPKGSHSLTEVEDKLSRSSLQQTMQTLSSQLIHLELPRFSFSTRSPLVDLMKKMGMVKSFSAEADFSGIDGMKDLRVSNAVHEAFFAIDEVGVTASGATAIVLKPTAVLPQNPPITFTADHPFLFFIVDLESKTLLFMGKFLSS